MGGGAKYPFEVDFRLVYFTVFSFCCYMELNSKHWRTTHTNFLAIEVFRYWILLRCRTKTLGNSTCLFRLVNREHITTYVLQEGKTNQSKPGKWCWGIMSSKSSRSCILHERKIGCHNAKVTFDYFSLLISLAQFFFHKGCMDLENGQTQNKTSSFSSGPTLSHNLAFLPWFATNIGILVQVWGVKARI